MSNPPGPPSSGSEAKRQDEETGLTSQNWLTIVIHAASSLDFSLFSRSLRPKVFVQIRIVSCIGPFSSGFQRSITWQHFSGLTFLELLGDCALTSHFEL